MAASTILVVGLGASGRAAAILIERLGAVPLVTDDRPISDEVRATLPTSARVLDAGEARRAVARASFVVTSPGVPAGHPLLREAQARRVPVQSELEFASLHVDAPIVAITGTNGKSTTVTLVGRILEEGGLRVFTGGNLGRPLSNAALAGFDACVVEVSSFQLEWVDTFRPEVAAVLNVTPDHLDRHGSMEEYIRTKLRIFARMDGEDAAVFCSDEDWWRSRLAGVAAEVSTFGRAPLPPGDAGTAYDAGARALADSSGGRVRLPDAWPVAPHDFANVAAAAEIARRSGSRPEHVERALEAFEPLAHRLALVGEHEGVAYWNDSKATNVGAALSSLAAFERPVILMAGGVAKGASFEALAGAAAKLKLVVAYGQARDEIARALGGAAPVRAVASFTEAFAAAREAAGGGDVVLLAPACASFDEFTSYADRGRRFCELVAGLGGAAQDAGRSGGDVGGGGGGGRSDTRAG